MASKGSGSSCTGVQATAAEAAAAAPAEVASGDWDVTKAGQSREAGAAHRPDVHVVLVEPQIPQNTGNVARTCAATNVALHLVGPMAFELDDKKLKRAGLDYWPHVCVKLHSTWEAFFAYFQGLPGPKRLIGYSVYGDTYYAGPEFTYTSGDWLLFGAETTGLPLQAHGDILSSGGVLVKIPIVDTYVRSINQSVSVGVGVFEALRQLDDGRHAVTPRDDESSPMVRLPTPMQAQQRQQQDGQQQDGQQQHQQKEEGAAVLTA
ncbi:Alpha/beta knot methyltransferase [Scenedesmus sp. NREL 46B-D3]|nr:Alpha/beta knot methyltransferase [Scenedesmus sp. NREL 46B-D3]